MSKRIERYEHVGKKYVGLSFHFGLEPFVRAILPADVDENAVAKHLTDTINSLIASSLPFFEWSHEPGLVDVRFCQFIKPREVEEAERAAEYQRQDEERERTRISPEEWESRKRDYSERLKAMSLADLFSESEDSCGGTIWDELCDAEIQRRQEILDKAESV